MYKDKVILAIIPARGGSKGIPRKNIKELAGKPLIVYSIDAALKSEYLDKVIVSTEDEEIAEISKKYGAEVVKRPKELAMDDSPTIDVVKHVLDTVGGRGGYTPDVIVILQPTSPLRDVIDIDQSVDKLFKTNADSVISVCESEYSPYGMYKLGEDDKISPFINSKYLHARRQDLPKVYRPNGAVYVTKRDIIMKENKILGDDTRALIMPLEMSIDIDTELDFKFTEFLLIKYEK